jgi:hypothetical protein
MVATSSNSPRILNYSKDSREIDLTELGSDRLLAHLIAKEPELNFVQEVFHGDLQRLYYDLGDMHTPYPNIEEYMEFTKVLIIK